MTEGSQTARISELIAQQQLNIIAELAPYEPTSAVASWLEIVRSAEECINLITADWDHEELLKDLLAFPVVELAGNPMPLVSMRARIAEQFTVKLANRFNNILVFSAAIAEGFIAHGIVEFDVYFQNVATLIGYFQSRRRHFVGLLHILPTACRGTTKVTPADALCTFLPIIELQGVQMLGAQAELIVRLSRRKLELPEAPSGELAMLDSLFLEPERAPIVDMPRTPMGMAMLAKLETLSPDRLFSASELRNDILLTEAAYAEFELHTTDFPIAARLIRKLSTDFIDRDFWVQVNPAQLATLLDEVDATPRLRAALINAAVDYMGCLSSYAPFVLAGGVYTTTVTLLSRFIYYWRAICLEHQKRYQIRTGFIFEDTVMEALKSQGFQKKDVTRINRSEFDVVTVRGEVIWNVQCKNNFVALNSVDNDAKRYARYNQGLVRAYEQALSKEKKREHLLKEKLGLEAIEHVVLSLFPTVSDNPRIIPFSRITQFAQLVDALSDGKRGPS